MMSRTSKAAGGDEYIRILEDDRAMIPENLHLRNVINTGHNYAKM